MRIAERRCRARAAPRRAPAAGSRAPPAPRAAGAARARAGRRRPPSAATAIAPGRRRRSPRPAPRSSSPSAARPSTARAASSGARDRSARTATGFASPSAARGAGARRARRQPERQSRTGRRRACPSTARPLDAEPAHAMAERVAPETEEPGRAHDVAARPRERVADGVAPRRPPASRRRTSTADAGAASGTRSRSSVAAVGDGVGDQERHALHQVARARARCPASARCGARRARRRSSRFGVDAVRGRVRRQEVLGQRRHVVAPRAQRGHLEDDDREPVVEVGAEAARGDQLAQVASAVAAMSFTSTTLRRRRRGGGRSSPRSPSGACPGGTTGSASTSSRKRLPPAAASKSPGFARRASVKAPASKPKSSASSIVSGMAAQLTSTNGARARPPLAWITRATRPLPVPGLALDQDRRDVRVSRACRTTARWRICSRSSAIAGASPIDA